jgi:hypothetical protein
MLNEKIIKICEQKFIYLNYSHKTKENYLSHIKKFLNIYSETKIPIFNGKEVIGRGNNYDFFMKKVEEYNDKFLKN